MTGGTTVILGAIGANFAAGMTGGMAYVYDNCGRFDEMVNRETVEAVPVTVPEWEQQLKSLIEEHLAETGSPRAKEILHRWDEELPKFVQVCPKEMVKRIPYPLRAEEAQKTA
jgi:glutamate synthase (NADPH/NADH) large chain